MQSNILNLAVLTLGCVWLAGCGESRSVATDTGASRGIATTEGMVVPAEDRPGLAEPADATEASEPAAEIAAEPAPPPPPAEVVKPKAPPADRTPRKPGDAEKITFEDLNLGMPADVVFREFMLLNSRAQELEGKKISIVGYMHGGQAAQRGIKEFILLKNTQCKFGPGGQADHLANVTLKADNSIQFTPSPIKVEGVLKLEPFEGPDGNTWSIYHLENATWSAARQ